MRSMSDDTDGSPMMKSLTTVLTMTSLEMNARPQDATVTIMNMKDKMAMLSNIKADMTEAMSTPVTNLTSLARSAATSMAASTPRLVTNTKAPLLVVSTAVVDTVMSTLSLVTDIRVLPPGPSTALGPGTSTRSPAMDPKVHPALSTAVDLPNLVMIQAIPRRVASMVVKPPSPVTVMEADQLTAASRGGSMKKEDVMSK